MTPSDPPTPKRQAEPPDAEGIWVRERRRQQWAHTPVEAERDTFHFQPGSLRKLLFEPGGGHTQHYHHKPGDIWEGPFPVPSLPETQEPRE